MLDVRSRRRVPDPCGQNVPPIEGTIRKRALLLEMYEPLGSSEEANTTLTPSLARAPTLKRGFWRDSRTRNWAVPRGPPKKDSWGLAWPRTLSLCCEALLYSLGPGASRMGHPSGSKRVGCNGSRSRSLP